MRKTHARVDSESCDLEDLTTKTVYRNLPVPKLVEHIIRNAEGSLSPSGVIMVNTGEFTGRSPGDKYIVDYQGDFDNQIAWGKINQPFSPKKFNQLLHKVLTYLSEKNIYVQEVVAGSDSEHSRKIRVISEFAWSALFSKNLFLEGTHKNNWIPVFTVIQAPGFKADPSVDGTATSTFIIIDFSRKIVLIGNTEYAGEIKKSVFTVMNRLLTSEHVLPMHCSANRCNRGHRIIFWVVWHWQNYLIVRLE
jgi:phosphoenolpyruvate carboxykinase (ATP)